MVRLGSVFLLLLLAASPASAERRIALVVGNAGYQNIAPLANAKNDATLIAETLRGVGFTLVGGAAQINLDKPAFDKAVQTFGNQLIGADVALFYHAGHGVQIRGSNYLVPVSANPVREADVDFQMVDVALILRQMEGSGTKLNLAILAANPPAPRPSSSASGSTPTAGVSSSSGERSLPLRRKNSWLKHDPEKCEAVFREDHAQSIPKAR